MAVEVESVTRETAGRGAQQERGGRSGCRGRGVIAPVPKATAVLARDVALEPALLPGKGRAQTKEAVVMGEADLIFRLAPKENKLWPKNNMMYFLSEEVVGIGYKESVLM
jgi:hypothetical protein